MRSSCKSGTIDPFSAQIGEDYRCAADEIYRRSKIAGLMSVAGIFIQAAVWSGPEHVIIFFRREIGTRTGILLILLFLTCIQAAFWAFVYSLGYESVAELVEHYRTHS